MKLLFKFKLSTNDSSEAFVVSGELITNISSTIVLLHNKKYVFVENSGVKSAVLGGTSWGGWGWGTPINHCRRAGGAGSDLGCTAPHLSCSGHPTDTHQRLQCKAFFTILLFSLSQKRFREKFYAELPVSFPSFHTYYFVLRHVCKLCSKGMTFVMSSLPPVIFTSSKLLHPTFIRL